MTPEQPGGRGVVAWGCGASLPLWEHHPPSTLMCSSNWKFTKYAHFRVFTELNLHLIPTNEWDRKSQLFNHLGCLVQSHSLGHIQVPSHVISFSINSGPIKRRSF